MYTPKVNYTAKTKVIQSKSSNSIGLKKEHFLRNKFYKITQPQQPKDSNLTSAAVSNTKLFTIDQTIVQT